MPLRLPPVGCFFVPALNFECQRRPRHCQVCRPDWRIEWLARAGAAFRTHTRSSPEYDVISSSLNLNEGRMGDAIAITGAYDASMFFEFARGDRR
jgi:hypothetical protein